MKTVLRTVVPMVAAVVVAWGIARTTAAQSSIPNGVFVRNSEGLVWLVLDGERIKIPVWQATDEEIAAIPVFDRWAVMDAVGAIVAGDRPAWLVDQPPAAVAAAQPVPSVPAPTSTPTMTTLRFKGDRGQNTAPFTLAAGNYVASFKTALRAGQTSCYTSADLYRVTGKRRVESIYSTTLSQRDGQTSIAGETRIYGVTAGEHFLEVEETGCSWSIELRPQ